MAGDIGISLLPPSLAGAEGADGSLDVFGMQQNMDSYLANLQQRLIAETEAEMAAVAPVSAPVSAPASIPVSAPVSAPAIVAAPAVGSAPAVSSVPADGGAPAGGTAQADGIAAADGFVIASENAPSSDIAPAVASAPAVDDAPAVDVAPELGSAAIAGSAPAGDSAPAGGSAPASDSTPAAGSAPAGDSALSGGSAPGDGSAPAGGSSSSTAEPPPPPPPPPANVRSSSESKLVDAVAGSAQAPQANLATVAPAAVPAMTAVAIIPASAPTTEVEEEDVGKKSWEDVSAAAASVWDMIMADEEEEAQMALNPVDAMFPNGLPGVSEVEEQVQQQSFHQAPQMMFSQGFPPMKPAVSEPIDPVDLMFPNGLPKASDVEDEPDPVDLMFPNGLPKASDVEEDPVDVMFPNGLPPASQVNDVPASAQSPDNATALAAASTEVSLPAAFKAKKGPGVIPGMGGAMIAETGTGMAPSAGLALAGVPPNLLPEAVDPNLLSATLTAPGALTTPDALPMTVPGLASVTNPGLATLPTLPGMQALPALPSMPAMPALPTPGAPSLGSSSSMGALSFNPAMAPPPPPPAGLPAPQSLDKPPGSAEGGAPPEAQMVLYNAAMEAQQAQYLQQMQFFQQLRNQPSSAPQKRSGGRFTDDFQPFRLCKRFMNGDCWQGSACTYAHDFEELHPASPDLPKEEETSTFALAEQTPSKPEEDTMPDMRLRKKLDICLKYKNSGTCERGKRCPYAHGEDELGTVAFVVCEKVKLRICKHWSQGACMYGKTCIYAHGAEEIGTKQPPFMGPPIKKRKEGESLDDWRKSVLRTGEEAKKG